MRQYVKIYCCGDCIYYNWKKHCCNLGAHEEGKAHDNFYRDCPLGLHEENEVTDQGLLNSLPSIESMTIHEVALILAELFDDPCACNYNGIDEWLPEKCEFEDACPHPEGVTCWEQYLKYQLEKIRE